MDLAAVTCGGDDALCFLVVSIGEARRILAREVR
jgi:hypothetical protein